MNRLLSVVAVASLLGVVLVVVGCEKEAKTDAPKTYNKNGLVFDYPGNWKVTEDEIEGDLRYLFVETPGDAIVVIQIYPPDVAAGAREFAEEFANATREQIPIATVSESQFSEMGTVGGYETLSERFTITLLGEDVPHTRTYRRRQFGDGVCFIVTQVADEDRSKTVGGFEQIASTFSRTVR